MTKSFCFVVAVLQVVFFTLELNVGGFDPLNFLLGPSAATLTMFGMTMNSRCLDELLCC